jgi:hypothetical protein
MVINLNYDNIAINPFQEESLSDDEDQNLYANTYDMPVNPASGKRVWIPQKQRWYFVWQARSKIYEHSVRAERRRARPERTELLA